MLGIQVQKIVSYLSFQTEWKNYYLIHCLTVNIVVTYIISLIVKMILRGKAGHIFESPF